MAESKTQKIAIVRVRGTINISQPLKHTFDMLNLANKNWCIVIENTPSNMGMIKKVKDFVTWGEISDEMYAELFEKKAEEYKDLLEDSKSKIKC